MPFVIILFFVTKSLLKPYVRQLPAEVTPWLHGKSAVHGLQ